MYAFFVAHHRGPKVGIAGASQNMLDRLERYVSKLVEAYAMG
jgi:hypothetical protein